MFINGRGRAPDYSTALLQTRTSAISAHGSSDYGFAGSFVAEDDLGRDQRIIDQQPIEAVPVLRSASGSSAQPLTPVLLHLIS